MTNPSRGAAHTPAVNLTPLDLTPIGANNWQGHQGPVLVLHDQATLHQKLALAWCLGSHIEGFIDTIMEGGGPNAAFAGLLWPHMAQLNTLLAHLGEVTASGTQPDLAQPTQPAGA